MAGYFFRESPLLQNDPDPLIPFPSVVDDAGRDRRAAGWLERDLTVIGRGEKIPVPRVAVAELVGQRRERPVLRLASEEELRRVDRPGAHEDPLADDEPLRAPCSVIAEEDLVCGLAVIEGMAPITLSDGLDPANLGQRRDVGAGALREGEVVDVERVLRVDVATDVALSAVRAPPLEDAELVGRSSPG